MANKTYKHTPAFILIFLAKEKNYGQALLNALNNELPCYKADSAVIYRSLQELEKEGDITSLWETEKTGAPRKWYEITDKGIKKLSEYKTDIENRKKNFEYFIDQYNKLIK